MLTCAASLLALVSVLSAPPDAAAIERYLERCAASGWSGAALVVRGGDVVISRGFGVADRDTGRANDPDTLFEIASATKPFTACAILRLQEMGVLSIDDPIADHLPGVPDDKRGITIRHLLSHTSGMPRSAGGGGDDLDGAVAGYLGAASARAPGEAFEYWNGGFALLAGIVERASGQPYPDFCRRQLFAPAGLDLTSFTGDATLPPEVQAVGYSGDRAVRRAAEHPYGSYGYQYRGMGGIVTSARELWQFTQALDAGRVLAPDTVRLMQTPVTAHYALGWTVVTTTRGTRRVGHGGDVRGFHTYYNRLPDEGAVVIVLSNVDAVPVFTIAWNLESLLFGEPPRYPMPPEVVALDDEALARLAGTYVDDAGEASVVVEPARGGLMISEERLGAGGAGGAEAAGFPEHAAQVAIAEGIVTSLRAGDADAIRAVLMRGIPEAWPDVLVRQIWPAHVERWGELQDASPVSARALAPGRIEVLFSLRHAKGDRRLQVILQNDRLNIFDLEASRHTAARRYVPVSATEFVTFDWVGRTRGQTVRFEIADGGSATIVMRPQRGGAQVRMRRRP